VLDAYGEIILRGWREAVGACLPEIETNLIQVGMHNVLQAYAAACVFRL
jgi:hypothetical protein